VRIDFNYRSAESYWQFLQVRKCPIYKFRGAFAHVPDEYAMHLGVERHVEQCEYHPISML